MFCTDIEKSDLVYLNKSSSSVLRALKTQTNNRMNNITQATWTNLYKREANAKANKEALK